MSEDKKNLGEDGRPMLDFPSMHNDESNVKRAWVENGDSGENARRSK